MRRFAALLLAICLLISLSACGTKEPPITPTATAEAEDLSAKIPMDEWERAAWYGFLPEDAGDPDSAVTWAQFCAMLGKAISLYDKSRLPAWEEETADAPEEEMRRDGGMVALLFGAKAMGLASFNALAGDCFGEYAGRVWEVVTMDYPLFDWDNPIDLGEGCADNNHVGPAYDFSQRRVSLVSGLPLLEFDEAGDLRLEQPFTIEEAALAVLRLYESEESCAAPAIEARDSTTHYDYVCSEVSKGIANVALSTDLPVLFGVLTTETIEQAIERAGSKAGNKGAECAQSAIEMVNLIRALGE